MSNNQKKTETKIEIGPQSVGRLDKFLAEKYPDRSRTYLQRLINARFVVVDDHPVSPHHQLRSGQTVKIKWPQKEVEPVREIPKTLPFPIIFEDDSFLILNKPPNLLCHPSGWRRDGQTVVELLRPYLTKSDWPDDVRPGLVHRLDRDTSGVLIFAKTPEAHAIISRQFSSRRVKKTYLALVKGKVRSREGTLECHLSRHAEKRQRFGVAVIGGRLAVTKFLLKEHFGDQVSLVELYPLTGRTHQLRVQFSEYGHPILGDHVYGGLDFHFPFIARQMLHAARIQFFHPKTNELVDFEAPLPDDFQNAIKLIRSAQ